MRPRKCLRMHPAGGGQPLGTWAGHECDCGMGVCCALRAQHYLPGAPAAGLDDQQQMGK